MFPLYFLYSLLRRWTVYSEWTVINVASALLNLLENKADLSSLDVLGGTHTWLCFQPWVQGCEHQVLTINPVNAVRMKAYKNKNCFDCKAERHNVHCHLRDVGNARFQLGPCIWAYAMTLFFLFLFFIFLCIDSWPQTTSWRIWGCPDFDAWLYWQKEYCSSVCSTLQYI